MANSNSPNGWRRPSMYDVAKVAGVSHMTVSRVLNGHPNIREQTRERVLAAIAETNFTPSSIARALATRRANRIGVIVDSPVQYGPNSTLRALEVAAREVGYAISAYSIAEGDGRQLDAGVVDLLAEGVDGLCVIAPRASSLDLLAGQNVNLPTVVIKSEPHPDIHTVGVDQHEGAMLAVNHLIEIGHRRIIHLAGPQDWYDARVRVRGWRDALTDAALDLSDPFVGDWTSDFGYRFGLAFEPDTATAIFAANDQMALGVIHGLHERGLRVPDDVSVVGFDDLPDARHFLPPLTTVRQDFAALGRLALSSIISAIDGEDNEQREMIAPKLKIRASTAPLRP
ncbi:DNA-binding LacI/PurR family transcriptional regulator [Microbacterium sp. W4I4]|uniref:LacI family DNA-binding transcriptional regulator n=1 Tax=Microbacterium sp. W4I4 TaxID=3042295 RepID=UPI0027824A1A|nr:LacI family DNA-binding transcriptional regulator [Microbacterium sp. W4I4]MDQ0613976.1 DNA-binding LacI/PurR family transcriptional regulator [Microbacterium sp. W4I4]